jgi:hypothetical protein
MKNQLDIITKFTMTFGIIGLSVICIARSANIAGVAALGAFQFHKTVGLESCIKKAFKCGCILTGSGLIVLGGSIGVAKYAGENLPDSYFTEEQEKYLAHTHKCNHCRYFHGHQYNGIDLICGIHPTGWEGDDCPDRDAPINIV